MKKPVSLPIATQQRLYDALRRIAREYRSSESIVSKPDMGLSGHECLEYAYDNIQALASAAIRGVRRPKEAEKTPDEAAN